MVPGPGLDSTSPDFISLEVITAAATPELSMPFIDDIVKLLSLDVKESRILLCSQTSSSVIVISLSQTTAVPKTR